MLITNAMHSVCTHGPAFVPTAPHPLTWVCRASWREQRGRTEQEEVDQHDNRRNEQDPASSSKEDIIIISERSPGDGNGNPPQYSCLENPMDGGA